MEALIARISSVFNLSKTFAITPAGLICALALAIVLWPPHPVDTYMQPAKEDYLHENDENFASLIGSQYKPFDGLTGQMCHFSSTILPTSESLSPEKSARRSRIIRPP